MRRGSRASPVSRGENPDAENPDPCAPVTGEHASPQGQQRHLRKSALAGTGRGGAFRVEKEDREDVADSQTEEHGRLCFTVSVVALGEAGKGTAKARPRLEGHPSPHQGECGDSIRLF